MEKWKVKMSDRLVLTSPVLQDNKELSFHKFPRENLIQTNGIMQSKGRRLLSQMITIVYAPYFFVGRRSGLLMFQHSILCCHIQKKRKEPKQWESPAPPAKRVKTKVSEFARKGNIFSVPSNPENRQ